VNEMRCVGLVHIDDRTRYALMSDQCKGIESAFTAGAEYAEAGNARPLGKQYSIMATAFLMGYDAWHRDQPYRDELATSKISALG